MTWSTKDARAWVGVNVAALLRIAQDENHAWLRTGPDGKPLDEFARRRVERAIDLAIKKAESGGAPGPHTEPKVDHGHTASGRPRPGPCDDPDCPNPGCRGE